MSTALGSPAVPPSMPTSPPVPVPEPTVFPPVVSRDEWLAARRRLLVREKDLTRELDALAAERRRMPMVRIDAPYTFETPRGKATLRDLFEGRRQLLIYHFMFDPNDPPTPDAQAPWTEGCPGCSHMADCVPHLAHLHARDTSFTLVSRAPLSKITPFKERMGWTIPWASSFGSPFNYDFHVTHGERVAPFKYNYATRAELEARGQSWFDHVREAAGISAFLHDGKHVYHTYSAYARGLDRLNSTYTLLDLTALGRQEGWEDSPDGWPQTPASIWWRHHDRYDDSSSSCCCASKAKEC